MAKTAAERFDAAMESILDKYVKKAARDTVDLNARSDSRCMGYVRIVADDACDFCKTLGSRDDFYGSALRAGGQGNDFHANCQCVQAPVFSDAQGGMVALDENGERMDWNQGELMRWYRENGSRSFKHDRERERAVRSAYRRGEVPGRGAVRRTAGGATRLSEGAYEQARGLIGAARSADELRAACKRIEAAWPKGRAGRDQQQWRALQREVRARDIEIRSGRGAKRSLASGLRNPATKLSAEQIEYVTSEAGQIGIPRDALDFEHGAFTCYNDETGLIHVRGDVFPELSSVNNRDLLSVRATLAHEYYGHRRFSGTILDPGDWRDEFRASYRAALDAPGLMDEDRARLMVDAYQRAADAGVTLRYTDNYRRIVYGY